MAVTGHGESCSSLLQGGEDDGSSCSSAWALHEPFISYNSLQLQLRIRGSQVLLEDVIVTSDCFNAYTVYSWEDASTRVKSVLSLHTNEPRIKVNKNNSGVKIMTLLRRIDAINCIWWHKMNFCKALDHFQTSFESPTLFCPCSLWNRNPETWMPSVWLFDKQNLFRMFSRDRMTWLHVDLGILYVIKN